MKNLFLTSLFCCFYIFSFATEKNIEFIIELTPENSLIFYLQNNTKKDIQLPKLYGYGHYYSGTEPFIKLKGVTKINGKWRELNSFFQIRCGTFGRLISKGGIVKSSEKVKIGTFLTSIDKWFLFDSQVKKIKLSATYNLGVSSQGTALGFKNFKLKSNTVWITPKKSNPNYSKMMYYLFNDKLNKKGLLENSITIKKEKIEYAKETLNRGLSLHPIKISGYKTLLKSSEYVYFNDTIKGKSVRFLLLETKKNDYLAYWIKKGNYKGHIGEYHFNLIKLEDDWKYK